MVAQDRLPPMPEMLQRPSQPAARPPIIRGGAPEELPATRPNPTVAQAEWKPIHIPTPNQLGIPSQPAAKSVTTIAIPERYDLATVTAWLDQQGVRSCQRERLAEGIRFVCQFSPEQTLSARGATDEEALKALVQEVLRHRQASALSLR